MSKRIFSSEEQKQLKKNPNVENCSQGSITYAVAFKERAVQQYEKGYTATEIFKQAKFDINLIGRKQLGDCLRRWRRQFKKKGLIGLQDRRGRKKGKGRQTEVDRLKWLEAEVKYLKAENAFLAQLRAKRAE